MRVVSSILSLRKILTKARQQGKKIGFVPTMGAFHDGHLSLMHKSKTENDLTVVSIFVNPTQFGPREDFAKYPRNKRNDILLAKKENVDIIFYPSVDEMYQGRYLTYITVEGISDALCGRSRPRHFRGVATVVNKLLNIVCPDVMYLGQKDAQQCVVLQQMVRDLNFPVIIKVVPTKRERSGLAMSSRNKYLTAQERSEAAVLYQSLSSARKEILKGNLNAKRIEGRIKHNITGKSSGTIEYVSCVDATTLQPLTRLKGKVLIALAVKFGKARLIDNILITLS